MSRTRRSSPHALAARVLLALGVALALADASVVTLALPEVLNDLDTDVKGVAAVIGVYTLVLAGAVVAALPLRRRVGNRALGAGGMLAFAAASVVCGLADSMPVLLGARAAQAVGAGGALVGAYALLHDSPHHPDGSITPAEAWRSSRLWVLGAIFGTALGPALGGTLTELFDWRAIFLAQAPIAGLAGLAALVPLGATGTAEDLGSPAAVPPGHAPDGRVRAEADPASTESHPVPAPPVGHRRRPAAVPLGPRRGTPSQGDRLRSAVALALVSAALTAVVFLLVLMLVAGWSMQPLGAALTVSILPVAAFAGYRIPGNSWVRACAGSGLIAAGLLTLTLIETDQIGWIVLPQVLAGVGMGLSLPALAGELLPERTPREAAGLLAWRHVGITVALLILAPITATQLDRTVDEVRLNVTALVLDAHLPPQEKLGAIRPALSSLNPEDARGSLEAALRKESGRFTDDEDQAATYAALIDRADQTLVASVGEAFRPAFLITGVLAVLAMLLTVPTAAAIGRADRRVGVVRSRPSRALAVTGVVCAGAFVVAGAQLIAAESNRPEAVVIADPCLKRDLPSTGGIDGVVQDVALRGIDRAACNFGSSREELVLGIVSEKQAKRYEQRYGTDPRSFSTLFNNAVSGDGAGISVGDVLQNLFK